MPEAGALHAYLCNLSSLSLNMNMSAWCALNLPLYEFGRVAKEQATSN